MAEFAGCVSEDGGMGMVGSDGPPGGPEAADTEEDVDDDEEDEVLPEEARPFDTTAAR